MNSREIISRNLVVYNSIKPKTPSNSYTVIATLNDSVNGKLCALASGTQACLSCYPNDIQDCHAESLVKRAYKRHLIDITKEILKDLDVDEVRAKELIRFRCEQELILFISKFPCGFIKRYEGFEPINEATGEIIKRKPGRGTFLNDKYVYVEKDDCITKLKKWLNSGVQGKRFGELFNIKCKLKRLILGNCEDDPNFQYDFYLSKLREHLSHENELTVELVTCVRTDEFIFNAKKHPQAINLVAWLPPSEEFTEEKLQLAVETIADGRKQGLTKKHIALNTKRLRIGNHELRKDIDFIEETLRNRKIFMKTVSKNSHKK